MIWWWWWWHILQMITFRMCVPIRALSLVEAESHRRQREANLVPWVSLDHTSLGDINTGILSSRLGDWSQVWWPCLQKHYCCEIQRSDNWAACCSYRCEALVALAGFPSGSQLEPATLPAWWSRVQWRPKRLFPNWSRPNNKGGLVAQSKTALWEAPTV
jgi:hypothetical protein